MNETWPWEIKNLHHGHDNYDLWIDMKKFMDNCPVKPNLKVLKDLWHFNQNDTIVLAPHQQYKLWRQSEP